MVVSIAEPISTDMHDYLTIEKQVVNNKACDVSGKKKKKTKKAVVDEDDNFLDAIISAAPKIAVRDNVVETAETPKPIISTAINTCPEVDNSRFRKLNSWAPVETRQTWPPTVPIDCYVEEKNFECGQILEYPGSNNSWRISSEEMRELERIRLVDYDQVRRAAECHRQTRKYVQSYVQPGMKMIDICQKLESTSKMLINSSGLEAGWAFPTGVSLNNCAAHYTPNYGDETVLQAGDIMKVDFGVHVKGLLVDCAFTVAFDPKFDPLIQATQEATNTGLKEAGIGARFSEIGGAIEEVIKSFEFVDDGKTVPIKPIENLSGHTVERYRIHAGKSLPIVRGQSSDFMEEGEVYAIETFASTGRGRVTEDGECSHYMLDYDYGNTPKRTRKQPRTTPARSLLDTIEKNFGTLAFCRRWLEDAGASRYLLALRTLIDQEIVNPYPPLSDIKGSFTSQMEHTVILRPTCKEVVTRGPDY